MIPDKAQVESILGSIFSSHLHLNSILMLGDCVGERLSLGLARRYRSWKSVKMLSLPCGVFLWKNDGFGKLGNQRFLGSVRSSWLPGGAFRKNYGLELGEWLPSWGGID